MICSKCGTEYWQSNICPVCGNAEEVAVVDTNAAPVASSEFTPEVPAATEDPGKTLGLVSLILGIVALACGTICSCIFACLGGIVPFLCGVGGIICAVMGKKKSAEAGFTNKNANIGMILSIAALVVIGIFVLLNAVLGGLLALTPAAF